MQRLRQRGGVAPLAHLAYACVRLAEAVPARGVAAHIVCGGGVVVDLLHAAVGGADRGLPDGGIEHLRLVRCRFEPIDQLAQRTRCAQAMKIRRCAQHTAGRTQQTACNQSTCDGFHHGIVPCRRCIDSNAVSFSFVHPERSLLFALANARGGACFSLLRGIDEKPIPRYARDDIGFACSVCVTVVPIWSYPPDHTYPSMRASVPEWMAQPTPNRLSTTVPQNVVWNEALTVLWR